MTSAFRVWPVPGHDGHFVREVSAAGLASITQAARAVRTEQDDRSDESIGLMCTVARYTYCDSTGELVNLTEQDWRESRPFRLLSAVATAGLQYNELASFDAAVETERGN